MSIREDKVNRGWGYKHGFYAYIKTLSFLRFL